MRSKIILQLSERSMSSRQASIDLGKSWTKIQRWRNRWLAEAEKLRELEVLNKKAAT